MLNDVKVIAFDIDGTLYPQERFFAKIFFLKKQPPPPPENHLTVQITKWPVTVAIFQKIFCVYFPRAVSAIVLKIQIARGCYNSTSLFIVIYIYTIIITKILINLHQYFFKSKIVISLHLSHYVYHIATVRAAFARKSIISIFVKLSKARHRKPALLYCIAFPFPSYKTT